MYRLIQESNQQYDDIRTFINILNSLSQHPIAEARTLFDPKRELIIARAPGRLDVMGGIGDYSGSLVLQMPLREATTVALQRQSEPTIQMISLQAEQNHRDPYSKVPLSALGVQDQPISYEAARAYFKQNARQHWAAYVAGAFLVLAREKKFHFAEGASILIHSDVPEGKGVSSSAALEVSTMQAVAAAFNLPIEPREMALLCQKVENLVVGAPCGVMDQMTSVCGEENRLMALLCQPAELQDSIAIPEAISIWGIDSGERHSVSGSDYTSVRVGTFMGYRMIAALAGLKILPQSATPTLQIDDPLWKGYLANIAPSVFEQYYAARLPEKISGRSFLGQYHGTTDTVTTVNPNNEYAVLRPTAHPIYEHFRVRTFAALLAESMTRPKLELLGELMYQAHASYVACGLGSPGTNRLVKLVRDIGPEHGLYGAKITGGGSGGTVAILGEKSSAHWIERIAETYGHEHGQYPYIFKQSSMGANRFGVLRLKP
ncbi:MAG: GHMP kinase [candidate division KSB1 bacterium]|nr:GHMP kinase [candidate division KSB1 bacterium]MDZ7319139.1 GHMP kinase [candidate division KSB1 bacterium]MDZ7340050.1 GHMP kinase [candidate division KSB1 bacterium]